MKCFTANNFDSHEKHSCVTFMAGEDYQTFLNYLKSLSEDNRYNGRVVCVLEHTAFVREYQLYFDKHVEYTHAYNYFLPDTVIHDYLKLMEDN